MPSLTLDELLAALPAASRVGPPGSPVITGVEYDSRRVAPGSLFLCVPGEKSDGHRFLPSAAARGAAAAVVERDDLELPIPALRVPSVRAAMGPATAALYGYPSRKLSLVGVTGTNGKTTTTFLIEQLARAAGRGTGVIGTIGSRINDETLPGERTTPEGPDLQALLARMAEAAGPEGMVVAMEASSHALHQGRTLGCEYDVGVFTNLTQDHLDYHGTMEAYFEAKALLFTEYARNSTKPYCAVINVDDPYGRRLAAMCPARVISYGFEGQGDGTADLRASSVQATPSGLSFALATPEGEFSVQLRLGGLFNVSNSLAAMGAGRALGIDWETILSALAAAPGVPGRFEGVDAGQDFSVIVDYAHTPDGVENVLRAARALRPRRLLVVLGCGGDRDRTKRPIMGRLAATLADQVILTSDNPRSEDPQAILSDIEAGIPADAAARVEKEVDRRRAIERAVALAGTGDLVVIAGKGHEDYQIFADRTVHFDDREEARMALNARLSS